MSETACFSSRKERKKGSVLLNKAALTQYNIMTKKEIILKWKFGKNK